MNEIKLSIIIPVYNVDKYLKKCLDSVLNQTMKDVEIICVNDGSTDKSRKILSEYEKKDSRIIIVDKKNGGLSSARNAGMKIAKGEYIGFVDSDDWIGESMYEKMYANAKQFDSQMVICAVHKFDEKKQQIVDDDPYFTLGYFDESFDNIAFTHEKTKDFLFETCVMAWNKIYKRSFLEEQNAQFPEGLIFEDGPFFFSIFFKMNKVSLIRDYMYFYRVNRADSIVQKGAKNFVNIFDVGMMMWKSIIDLPYFEEIKYTFFEKRFNDFAYRFDIIKPIYRKIYFERFKQFKPFFEDGYFDFEKIKKDNFYLYQKYTDIKNNTYWGYETRHFRGNFKDRFMYKIMEILYYNPNCYSFKIFGKYYKIKKRPKIIDIYYLEDFIYVIFLKKEYKIPFNFTELENRNKS